MSSELFLKMNTRAAMANFMKFIDNKFVCVTLMLHFVKLGILMKTITPLEKHEQIAFCAYLELKRIPHFAIPNGGSRNTLEAISMRQQGVSAGVPDLMVPVPSGEHNGLFIEMKRKGGTMKDLTANQREWHKVLRENGYAVTVCFGAEKAIESVNYYLKGGQK